MHLHLVQLVPDERPRREMRDRQTERVKEKESEGVKECRRKKVSE